MEKEKEKENATPSKDQVKPGNDQEKPGNGNDQEKPGNDQEKPGNDQETPPTTRIRHQRRCKTTSPSATPRTTGKGRPGEFNELKKPWNEIVAQTCEGFRTVDGNIPCPACMNIAPNVLTICLHCHWRFMSCGVRNTVATTTTIEIDDDHDEVKIERDVEMEQPAK